MCLLADILPFFIHPCSALVTDVAELYIHIMTKKILYLLAVITGMALFMPSCMTKRKLARLKSEYQILQSGMDSISIVKPWEGRKIRSGDKLIIQVKSESLNSDQIALFDNGRDADYVVNHDGNINMPMAGKIFLRGFTRFEAIDTIRARLSKYVLNPFVTIRPLEVQVKLLGQFERQGIVSMPENDATILNALSQSGGINQFARRDSVWVIREDSNKRHLYAIDLRSGSSLFNSDVFQLQQNDVVFAQPNKIFYRSLKNTENNVNLGVLSPLTAILGILFFTIPIISFFNR